MASGDSSFGLREQPDGRLAFNSSPEIDHNYADTGLPGPALVPDGRTLAGVDDLAAQVRAAGIREVRGNVVIDDRLFTTFRGWPDGLISPIWVNENVVDITTTATVAGQPAGLDWRPRTAAYRVVSEVTTTAGEARFGASRASTILFDGAGSDERDRTSPADMVRFLRSARNAPWGDAFHDGLAVLGIDGDLATMQVGTPAAGKVRAKTGSRAAIAPTGQGVITALTMVGYAEAASGRRLAFAIFLRDLGFRDFDDFFAARNDQGAIAAAIQQGY